MGWYSAITKEGTLILAATWTDLEDIVPSEISQNKTGAVGSHLCVESRNIQLTETESGVLVAGERR